MPVDEEVAVPLRVCARSGDTNRPRDSLPTASANGPRMRSYESECRHCDCANTRVPGGNLIGSRGPRCWVALLATNENRQNRQNRQKDETDETGDLHNVHVSLSRLVRYSRIAQESPRHERPAQPLAPRLDRVVHEQPGLL